ncbi:PadR family transcriptional regulator [Rahnella sp. Lac-M11]|jgi:DNA-binding PadR family transcriptional regulator|uniref:PadR family transcriptional regulator n=1 Tax=Rahnella contaminans TaxID=2703882 RepID=A0A6M2B6P7_9GAMM|nr:MULTISPECIES: PadR family transcriptional regulator [Rahnella]KAB8307681.1 PadR family transcriptional regulator [Rouxiella chamberiensis]MBU9820116.1 PadR family transcriptional regulator [Rahnella sp. BCC 1045]MDF1895188.1 PadR family transcriptional regulator [Rahnella contaminans]NGX88549.1 PadR family transcriptional regulator [Rahnella contaminans]
MTNSGPAARRKSKLFTRQELTLFVLHLIQINPAHGYEIIKTIEGYSMGAYIPSPGVIYPILTLIVEEGFATATDIEGGKKQFTMTPDGSAFLALKRKEIRVIEEKMKTLVIKNNPPPAPELIYAIENLKITVRAKSYNGEVTPEKYAQIIEYVNEATRKINEL